VIVDFTGTDRFKVIRRLGAGGMGVVYAAQDTHREELVALKTLLYVDAAAIYRLKKEFRALADVSHPNLVALYELIAVEDDWFFTMELVEGVGFLQHVRPEKTDIPRLRATMVQLAEGLRALHATGTLHRDLKPSNVMVTPAQRTVILDFGIAMDLKTADHAPQTIDQGIWGTPAYMSPEQVNEGAVEASDWYSLGVMLYEALTGSVPFSGSFFTMLTAKMKGDVQPPDHLAENLPQDLVRLCLDLLTVEPGARPGAAEVIRRLGGPGQHADPISPRPHARLIGRDRELKSLDEAWNLSRSDGSPGSDGKTTVLTMIHGVSGSGKSRLIDEFLSGLARADAATILSGRCYFRESVPFKGLDGVLDSLSRWLLSLPAQRQAQLLTPELAAAARLFPALGRIENIPVGPGISPDPQELRKQAVVSLRHLLRAMASEKPVVIAIDDFQWGDSDSARLLVDILEPPHAPPILVIIAYRRDEVERHEFLDHIVRRARAAGAPEIAVEPLSEVESLALATDLLGELGLDTESVVREAGGSPFLIEQLARHAIATRDDTNPRQVAVSATEMLARRIAELPPHAGTLLETLAVAARPVDSLVARDAAGLEDERPLIKILVTEHLLRPSATASHVELYHDRIREVIVAGLEPARLKSIHRHLAQAIEARGHGDPEILYEHYIEIGDPRRALEYGTLAAGQASRALAFERAALLYRQAIRLAEEAGEPTFELEVNLAHALGNAGRGPDSADMFLSAAGQADEVRTLDLQLRASEQLLRCGHVERGFQVIQDVMKAAGIRPARSSTHALVRLLVRRAQLRFRGLKYVPTSVEKLPESTIRELDLCWAVALGLVRVDNVAAADIQVKHLLLALEAGEPYRIAKALAMEAAFVSLPGGPARARTLKLLAEGERLARQTANPHAIGIVHIARAVFHEYVGEFEASVREADLANTILREQCTGVWWEIQHAGIYAVGSLYYCGRWRELADRVPSKLNEALTHGDRYVAAEMSSGRPNTAWLLADDPAEARRVVDESATHWEGETFHVPHWLHVFARAQIDLYEGDARSAWAAVEAAWSPLRKAMLLRIQMIRIEAMILRARCALGAAGTGSSGERRQRRKQAEMIARSVLKERMPWATPLAHMVEATLAFQGGRKDVAADKLRMAAAGFTDAGMFAHAMAAKRRMGDILGGDEGRDLLTTTDAWFDAQGGRRPDRLTEVLAPGFSDSTV